MPLELIAIPYMIMSFAIIGLRKVFALRISLNANWVLRTTQMFPMCCYKVPLTCSYLRGKMNFQMIFWASMIIFLPAVVGAALIEQHRSLMCHCPSQSSLLSSPSTFHYGL